MTRKLLIGVSVFALLICTVGWFVVCVRAERSRLKALAEWRVAPRQGWPETLLEILREAELTHVHLGRIAVLHRPYYGEYLLTCDTSAELLDVLVARWRLSPVSQDHELVYFARERMPPGLSSTRQPNDTAHFISAGWLAGEKCHWYYVMEDKAEKRIAILYSYNF